MTRALGIVILLATLLFEAALVFGGSGLPERIAEVFATTYRERAGDIEEGDPGVEEIVGLNVRWMIDHEDLFRIRCERAVFDEFVRRHGVREADEDQAREIARLAGELAPSWREPLARRAVLYADDWFDPMCRGPDGWYAATFFDDETGTMFLWLKDMF